MLNTGSPDLITLLLISSIPENRSLIEQICRLRNWRFDQVSTCREAMVFATLTGSQVVICEQDLPDGHWKAILSRLKQLSEHPKLIVTSRLADEELWAEVLNIGGYDVVQQPLDPDEVCRVVISAWEQSARRD